ncbi:MAG TPA: glycosyltransferase [Candidatus Sulfotelmatobacter sp.]|nr:glycosyltransferase [Candidatus Sulfotelmatobacter sp.]
MPNPSAPPIVAIVIPLFKHSVLVVDAVESAINQQSRYPFTIVVVNDGCPFRESDLQIKSISAVHPDIRYVVQQNRGLSAARNTGIDYALDNFPTVQAIYFMDADNTILPGAIDAAYSKLQAEPLVSWVYPNIDMFGIRRNYDYSGPYSLLKHTQENICEAGSMVHRRVFDAGIRFDEKMRLGYEDWDFWLTAAGHGFRGAQHPHFGFRYRNRGESMLSQAHRDDGEIQSYMQRKHTSLLSRRSPMRLESLEALRYAIIFTDTNQVLLTSGSSDPASAISQAEFDELVWRNLVLPTHQHIPPFFVLMTRTTFDKLSRLGLILWVLHDGEVALKEMNISCLVIRQAPGCAFEVKQGGPPSNSDVLVLGRELVCAIIRSADTSWIERLVSPDEGMKVVTKTLTIPRQPGLVPTPEGSAAFALLVRIRSWRASPYRPAGDRSWLWREFSVPPPHSLYLSLREAFSGEVVYPWPSTAAKNIGFVLPIASFGGVERIAYNLAQQFARQGWRPHLFVIGQTRIEVPHEFGGSLASINFLNDPVFGAWDTSGEYQGTTLPAARNDPRATNRIVAALAWLDAVVNCHSAEFSAAAASLGQFGVKTAAELQLLDMSPLGRSVGHPLITLAYEHAYDLVLCNSQQLMSWMHGAGIPYEKLLRVPNAPGHPVDATLRETIMARRRSSSNRRLNALYVGRLDRQKGIDRLAEVVQQTQDLELPINWRIVGSSVIGDFSTPPILESLLEPAVFDSEKLTSLFSWADVMVLLSDYEGVPLSILEAQRLGVVVIATDTGAVSEIISPGQNGFLVKRETAIDQTIGWLKVLLEAPALRSRIAEAASQVMEWPEATADLIRRMTALVEAERTKQAKGPKTTRDLRAAAGDGA